MWKEIVSETSKSDYAYIRDTWPEGKDDDGEMINHPGATFYILEDFGGKEFVISSQFPEEKTWYAKRAATEDEGGVLKAICQDPSSLTVISMIDERHTGRRSASENEYPDVLQCFSGKNGPGTLVTYHRPGEMKDVVTSLHHAIRTLESTGVERTGQKVVLAVDVSNYTAGTEDFIYIAPDLENGSASLIDIAEHLKYSIKVFLDLPEDEVDETMNRLEVKVLNSFHPGSPYEKALSLHKRAMSMPLRDVSDRTIASNMTIQDSIADSPSD